MASYEIVRPFEVLEQLGRDYHRVQHDHGRAAAHGAARRRLEADMEQIAQRFERVLEHWAADEDEELRATWRRYFYGGGPPPQEPDVEPPCLFRGEAETGARVEVRPTADGGHDIVVDGAVVEHSAARWRLDAGAGEPLLVGGLRCRELFDAPAEAVRALGRFVATPESVPPWRWARELFDDGLIDGEFATTARGRRALAAVPAPDADGPQQTSYCVIAADAARARILTLAVGTTSDDDGPDALVEICDLANPARRAHDGDLVADTRGVLRGARSGGPPRSVDVRRRSQPQEADRRFAELVAAQAAAVWRQVPRCHIIVVALPGMLGDLRPAIARHRTGATPPDIDELVGDLSRLAAPALHDALAEAGLLPARGRMPPGPTGLGPGSVGVTR
ncbi:MAG TPA: host attachment protein [Kofleriaceae bacterium]|nr:host attachment protein [Kofleriaceae bacterium]